MQWCIPSSQIGHRPAGTTEFASGSIGNRPTWTHHVNCLIEGPFGEGNTAALLLKRPDGRCRRIWSISPKLSVGTIKVDPRRAICLQGVRRKSVGLIWRNYGQTSQISVSGTHNSELRTPDSVLSTHDSDRMTQNSGLRT